MPFFTEEIYESYYSESIVISKWPEVNPKFSFRGVNRINVIFDIITAVRNIRAEYKIGNSKPVDLEFETNNQTFKKTIKENEAYLKRFCNYSKIQF